MAPECSISFSFIGKVTGETETIRIRDGLNKVSEEDWERIEEKEYTKRLLTLGALRVMEAKEVKDLLDKEDLDIPEDVSLAGLKIADASKVVASAHDLQKLDAWLADEQRVPVRQAITRRIAALTGGD
jgi:hypothetical protein